MNNKGFGIGSLLVFLVFSFIVLVFIFMIVRTFAQTSLPALSVRNSVQQYNYKNEYTVYMKKHNLVYNG